MPDWLFKRKSGTIIYIALSKAEIKQTGERMKNPHYLFCGHLPININKTVEIYQLEGDLQLEEYY